MEKRQRWDRVTDVKGTKRNIERAREEMAQSHVAYSLRNRAAIAELGIAKLNPVIGFCAKFDHPGIILK